MALLVAPLAGIALLTAAAAVAINPVLVTVSLTGRRRKRNAEIDEGISPELEEKIHEMQVSGMMCDEERTALQMLLFAGAGEIHVEHSRKHELSATGETRALVTMRELCNWLYDGLRVHTADNTLYGPVKVTFIEHIPHPPPQGQAGVNVMAERPCHSV